jgi:hypothetical protein
MPEESNMPTSPCDRSEHSEHLCILTGHHFHIHEPEKYRAMVKEPEFKCQFCGRTAKSGKNLCYPIDL